MRKRAERSRNRKRLKIADDEPPSEPEECDLVTTDHMRFYEVGTPGGPKITVGLDDDWRPAVRAYMERTKYWPSVWFISDHGNSHLLSLED
jgi:hypothetical protein